MRNLAAFVLWWAMCSSSFAQSVAESTGMPGAPESHIHDPGNILRRKPDTMRAISNALQSLQKKHGYSIYLYLDSVFLSSNPQDVAENARQAWVPDDNGMTIAYEADTRRFGFGQNIAKSFEIPASNNHVPLHEADSIIRAALAHAKAKDNPDTYLEDVILEITNGYDAYFLRRFNHAPPAGQNRTIFIILGGACLIAVGALGIAMRRGRVSSTGERMEFPAAEARERLGAPYGAKVVSRAYHQPHDP